MSCKRWCLLLSSLLPIPPVSTSGLQVEGFYAGVNPIKVNGVFKSFVEFSIRPLGSPANTSVSCFNWADTPDKRIESLADAPCAENTWVSFAFQLVADEGVPVPPQATDAVGAGYNLDVLWRESPVELSGTHFISLDEIAWAQAEGQNVQVYAGLHEFTI